ncbi:uncharacterized protein LOC133327822 [Musca vetustissima]|uniref:uncharacterized protein LOC133327822 n=1 Tax=Musca vetustissima TaxID=27455 RepID=UPI002AB6C517|nr:uncharacterized protein LOC133327822 [Musca vetustissima]
MDDKPPPNPSSSKSQYNADKQTEAGAGITNQDFRQNHPQPQGTRVQQPPPMPHELTAEWTVRAQLRFARAGETVRKDFSTNDPINPVRVVYKWTTLDADGSEIHHHHQPEEDDVKHTNIFKRNSSRSSGYSHQDPAKPSTKPSKIPQKQESFRSTTSSTTGFGGGDSAFSGSNTSHHNKTKKDGKSADSGKPYYGTRCRSTCNIIVSAVADFLPPPGSNGEAGGVAAEDDAGMDVGDQSHVRRQFVREEEPDPFVFNTTACYTVLPEKSKTIAGRVHTPADDAIYRSFTWDRHIRPSKKSVSTISSSSTSFTFFGKILNLKDAVCQTSDTETKYFEEYEHKRFKQSHSPLERRDSRRSYDHRRATAEALLQTPRYASGANEGNTFMPSYLSSPKSPQAFKSASMPRIPSIEGEDVSMGANFGPLGSLPAFMASNKTVQSGADVQKKPRTVHIDVYCTGSEDEDHADAESSSESEDNRRHDQESNSTFQTVLDNEQMRLRHQRMSGAALPRRLGGANQQQQQQKSSSELNSSSCKPSEPQSPIISGDLQLGHGITKSSTTDEVNESKHILFRKHIGDQRAIKLANLRQKYLRQSSEDVASLGYPSSTRSTVLDNTCSSMSSVLAGHDVTDAHWKDVAAGGEDNEDYSLTKSESFEYENALDRLRIRQMERLWSRSHSKEDESAQNNPMALHQPHHQMHPHQQHPHLQTIAENNNNNNRRLQRDDTLPSESDFTSETDQFYSYPTSMHQQQRTTSPAFQQTQHFTKNRPGFLHFFGPQNELHLPPPEQPMSAPIEGSLLYPNYQPSLQRWKSETRENLSATATPALTPTELSRHASPQPQATGLSFQRSGSEAPPTTTSASTFPVATPTPARRLDLFQTYRQSPAMSEASTGLPPPGYSSEYLDKASKFGKVVAARKPGHHVGPTKNPNCSCESCQRWMAERFQVRGRAFSLGESPVLRRTK